MSRHPAVAPSCAVLALAGMLLCPQLRAQGSASATTHHGRADGVSGQAVGSASTEPAVDPPPRRRRILIMDLTPVGVDKSMVTVLGGLITDAVARYPSLQTISTTDIRNLVELESGKQQVGCDSNSCLAEVAGAMGAEYVIFGNVGMLGTTTVVQLSLFDADRAQAVARRSIKVTSHEALAVEVEPAMADLLRGLLPANQLPVATTTTAPASAAGKANDNDLGWMLWTGAIVGSVSAVALAATYFSGLFIALQSGAPGEFLQLMAIPVVGPVQSASMLQDEINKDPSGGSSDQAWAVPLSYGIGGAEALLAVGSAAGLGVFALGTALDGNGLPLAGHLWQWGLLALGGGLAAGGLALDYFPDTSRDHQVDLFDGIPLVMYGGAALCVGAGLLLNPFEESE
ncbi:MAG: hypothetical protein ABIJ09_07925 [Pseudomonadota bacterium]